MISLKTQMTLLALCACSCMAFAAEQSSTYKPSREIDNVSKTTDAGIGLQMGSFTGLSGKYWTSETKAWDAAVAFENSNTALSVDRLWHARNFFSRYSSKRQASYFVPYGGLGLVAVWGDNDDSFDRRQDGDIDNFGLAARIPLGLELMPAGTQLGAFAEVAPGLGLTPWNYSFISANIGARAYF